MHIQRTLQQSHQHIFRKHLNSVLLQNRTFPIQGQHNTDGPSSQNNPPPFKPQNKSTKTIVVNKWGEGREETEDAKKTALRFHHCYHSHVKALLIPWLMGGRLEQGVVNVSDGMITALPSKQLDENCILDYDDPVPKCQLPLCVCQGYPRFTLLLPSATLFFFFFLSIFYLQPKSFFVLCPDSFSVFLSSYRFLPPVFTPNAIIHTASLHLNSVAQDM